MQRFDTWSFGTKLVWSMTLASVVAVVMVCAVLTIISFMMVREITIDSMDGQARTIAMRSTAALSFNDADAAGEMLASLAAITEVASATIYDSQGRAFARYACAANPPPALPRGEPGYQFVDGWLVRTEPIVHDGETLGTLLIVHDWSGVRRRMAWNTAASLSAGAVATAVAFLMALWLQRLLSRPVAALSAAARTIAQAQDYSIRAVRYHRDDLGDLTDAFNTMLDQIQFRDARLEEAGRALAQSNHELVNRTEEMERFVYTVSHDLKSPVVTLSGFLAMLSEDIAAGRADDVQDSIKHIQSATDRMGRLIQDLLEISRIGRVCNEPQEIDTTALIREIGESLAPQLGQGRATLDIQPDMPRLMMDRMRLSQVFENLLTNAIKYGGNGSETRITVGAKANCEDIRFYVKDEGPGIPREYHEKVFSLFQRLHNDNRGTGVGLAIVARVMQVHGGRTWVESEPGQGATFWLSFPARHAAK